jgi:DNA-binding NarL/FixJ family response regulator
MPIRIAISCSNHLFSEGIRRLLEDERDIKIIGIFNSISGESTDHNALFEQNPDIIIGDYTTDFNFLLSLPEEIMNDRRLRILLVGDRTTKLIANKYLKELVIRGVVGILPPSADSDLLKKALRAVVSGELWLDRHTLMTLISSIHRPNNAVLAKREKEIMFHICQGYRNREIAQKLNISEQTVKSHCNRIYKKLGVTDRLQLALYSFKILPNNTKD